VKKKLLYLSAACLVLSRDASLRALGNLLIVVGLCWLGLSVGRVLAWQLVQVPNADCGFWTCTGTIQAGCGDPITGLPVANCTITTNPPGQNLVKICLVPPTTPPCWEFMNVRTLCPGTYVDSMGTTRNCECYWPKCQ
jgi:hypothetical protein